MAGSGRRAEVGVYVIRCLATGEAYVEQQPGDVAERLRAHRRALRAGRHHNRWLQEAWAAHGEACFTMELVERVDDSWMVLLRHERAWMDRLDAEGCALFNAVSPCAVRWDARDPKPASLSRIFDEWEAWLPGIASRGGRG